MSENDLIAEYVKENYPELLQTMDFTIFKFAAACRKFANDFSESFKQLDLVELQLKVDEINKRNAKAKEGE